MGAMSSTSGPGWYTPQSPLTDPGRFAPLLDGLPRGEAAVTRAVQGLVIQPAPDDTDPWTDDERLRFVADMLALLAERDDRPLTEARKPAERVRGNCRNSAVLVVAMLRHQGVPARKRTGFARYIATGRAIIHEVAESWGAGQERWAMVDADVPQRAQRAYLDEHGAADMRSADGFVTGGDAWLRCRSGRADPDEFQFRGGEGLRLVRQALLQDLDGLNRVELLSRDLWGGDLDEKPIDDLTREDLDLLDHAAGLTFAADERLAEMRRHYADSARGRSVLARLAELR
jgi:transglutaminase superfamily protein